MTGPADHPPFDLWAEARRCDPDRALCTLFGPAARREELAALVLLNHELARVAETVRQPLAGLVRHRFWRDQLAAAAEGGRIDHPIAAALASPLRENRLALAELEALIAAREAELDGLLDPESAMPQPPPDATALEAYLRATSGGLARAMARLLEAPAPLLAAAEAAGTAFGLVGIVRATVFEARRARRVLARSLVDMAGLEPRLLDRPETRARLRAVVAPLLARAEAAIVEARRLAGRADRAFLAPLLLATVADVRLRELRRAGDDPFTAAERPAAALPLHLLAAWLRARP
ncbi:MAG: squalene/phytoene synthase family protein [Geminicoccaceae bacterium]|nr:squalene/phytoene synthase family protein [Geminicoccaceae bacterium]MCX8102010.1 squalene/phytoene synthase family protein [Geminicoccaceae bacterium]MDW8369307.1 squalene/phytoene synthase family protein [Geminicoccaceae bacterium]